LDEEAKKAGILLLNEIGLDPGIDHMSAMQIIDRLKAKGEVITLFKSYCGGLVAPESNDNPWGYKFSWNPRNVVLAGQSTAQYIENDAYKYIPYNRLFTQINTISVENLGNFDGYANRDSLSYRKPYGLENIPTLLRGTLRMTGYCKAWNVFVKLGLTDDSYQVEDADKLTYKEWIESYLPFGNKSTLEKLKDFMGEEMDTDVLAKLHWLGILEDAKIPMKKGSPAQLLQHLLETKWVLKPQDKDMIVMQHQFEVENRSMPVKRRIYSTLVVKGD
ncbi:MAG: saccharopine dehydrogenase C-terminal domain-containing protein, partial [Bacteroidota bacterium]